MRIIFLLIFLAAVEASSYAQPVVTYVATDIPIPIPDGPFGIGRSTMEISDNYVILDINVIVTIFHTYDQDLGIYLEAPGGDIVRLAYQCGLSGDNYIETCFDDEANIDNCDGSPPFTGCFRPDQALNLFDNLRTNGTWEFRVLDSFSGQTGSIQAWRLEILADTNVSAPDLPVITSFSVGQNFPNPFNATTVLPIELNRPSQVSLRIFNSLGQTVLDGRYELGVGTHRLSLDGSAWSSGNYLARVESGKAVHTVRLTLLK